MADVINDVNEMLDQLDPLGAISEWAGSLMDDALSWFDFSVTQSLGGDGDDFLASGSGGGDMVGGLGNDTYLFNFGYDGTHVVDEAGMNAVRDWGNLLGADDGLIDTITTGGGGSDVIEITGPYGLFDIGTENLAFNLSHSGDLTIGLQTEGGLQFSMGEVVLKDMDDTENRIETLRIVNQDDIVNIDLGAAFDAGLFETTGGLSQWWDETIEGFDQILDGDAPMAWTENANAALDEFIFVDTSGAKTTVETFEEQLDAWVDNLAAVVPTAEKAADRVTELAEGVTEFANSIVPEFPDVFDFV